jgi:hypothetical protein
VARKTTVWQHALLFTLQSKWHWAESLRHGGTGH